MIQRIQSVFLLVAAIVTIILLFMNIGYISTDEAQYTFTCFNVNHPNGNAVMSTLYIALILIVSACISIYAIFRYKDRMKQTRVVSFNMFVFLVAIIMMIWLYPDYLFQRVFQSRGIEIRLFKFNYWIMIFVIPPVCMFLANRFIRKDERLVRSADRLR